jgi:rubredoxin
MKCAACGYEYDNDKPGQYIQNRKTGNGGELSTITFQKGEPWIELTIVERGPFFTGTPDAWPTGGSIPAIKRGTPTKIYACPQCGTVRIDV